MRNTLTNSKPSAFKDVELDTKGNVIITVNKVKWDQFIDFVRYRIVKNVGEFAVVDASFKEGNALVVAVYVQVVMGSSC